MGMSWGEREREIASPTCLIIKKGFEFVHVVPSFTVAKSWKQPKCPSVNEWIKKLWSIYTMEYYAAEKNEELLPS